MSIAEERVAHYTDGKESNAYTGPICNTCKHREFKTIKCKAYPGGIPDSILSGDVDHTKPYIRDNGIQYEAIEETNG